MARSAIDKMNTMLIESAVTNDEEARRQRIRNK
jgi:hypothetical protein